MLKTQTRLEGKILVTQGISQIGSQDIIQMLVMAAAVFIINVVPIITFVFLKIIFTDIVTDDIFHSRFYCMQFADGSRIIHLESMLRGIGLSKSM